MTLPTSSGTVQEALGAATDALAAAGVETPRLDAELLLAEAMGDDRVAFAAAPETQVEAAAARVFGQMVRRRVAREPLAYITGRRAFRRLELRVDTRALIPRPETELLVEIAVELQPGRVLDVGTGSGAVALAVADELPTADVVASDSSGDALALAVENADRLGLADGVRFEAGSVPEGGRFDLVLANLPYVREDEWGSLQPEIIRYEPREALIGGPEGLDAIKALLAPPPDCDAIALEVGANQAGEVDQLVRAAGFARTERRRDLAGIERVVLGRREG